MQDVEHQHKAHRSIRSPEPIDYKVSALGDDVSTPRPQNPRCSSCHHSRVDIHGVRARRGPLCCIFRESSVTASQLNDIPGQTLAVERVENAGRIKERLPLFLGRHSTVANLSHSCLHARPCRISWPRRCKNVRPTLQSLHDRAIRSTGSAAGGRHLLKCIARLRQLTITFWQLLEVTDCWVARCASPLSIIAQRSWSKNSFDLLRITIEAD